MHLILHGALALQAEIPTLRHGLRTWITLVFSGSWFSYKQEHENVPKRDTLTLMCSALVKPQLGGHATFNMATILLFTWALSVLHAVFSYRPWLVGVLSYRQEWSDDKMSGPQFTPYRCLAQERMTQRRYEDLSCEDGFDGPFLLQKRGAVGITGSGEVIVTIIDSPNNALLKWVLCHGWHSSNSRMASTWKGGEGTPTFLNNILTGRDPQYHESNFPWTGNPDNHLRARCPTSKYTLSLWCQDFRNIHGKPVIKVASVPQSRLSRFPSWNHRKQFLQKVSLNPAVPIWVYIQRK